MLQATRRRAVLRAELKLTSTAPKVCHSLPQFIITSRAARRQQTAVFAVADVLTVMVNGAVLASGPPEKIRESRAVQDAFRRSAADA